MKFNLLGLDWTIVVIGPEGFLRRFGEESAGITLPTERRMFINSDDLTLETIAHELWHGALESLCLTAATLKRAQLEEIQCELFALHGARLLKLASKLHRELAKE